MFPIVRSVGSSLDKTRVMHSFFTYRFGTRCNTNFERFSGYFFGSAADRHGQHLVSSIFHGDGSDPLYWEKEARITRIHSGATIDDDGVRPHGTPRSLLGHSHRGITSPAQQSHDLDVRQQLPHGQWAHRPLLDRA